MVRKSQINLINILQRSLYEHHQNIFRFAFNVNLKKDTGISFESQESRRMIKVKVANENFSFEISAEDTVANAVKNLPTSKASVPNHIPVSITKEAMPKNNTNHEWLSEK